ncbi:MAG TPA: aspartate aminotransferase family protein [Bacilli bacterium]|nr:aspartate aminotransferase family protein [Bacilli bacterium]
MSHLIQNYGRFPLTLVKGEGVRVQDDQGKTYLDFTSGIGVTGLGHAHPKVTQAVQEQAATLLHTSNLFHHPLGEQVAAKLAALSGLDQAFFCNSGAEANEAAIKLARKHSQRVHGAHKYEILTLHDSFHGRTLATVTATCRPAFHEGFHPLVPGFRYVPKNLDEIEAALSENTCAILAEPVQGEGGVMPLSVEFLQGLRALCDRHGLLLIFDEVQTGIGRTSTMFAYEQASVTPDILSLAKALGNGVPIGAMLAKGEVASAFTPGSHGTTFGGNPLVLSAAWATLNAIEEEGLIANAAEKSAELEAELQRLVDTYPHVLEQRGLGLMRGLLLDRPVALLVNRCIERGLLVLNAGANVIRLLPPLILTSAHIEEAVAILETVLQESLQEA